MNRTSQTDRGTRFRALHFLVGLLAISGTVAAQAPSAAPPKFDKAKIKSVVAAMTLEEKAALVVGEGGAFGPPPAPNAAPAAGSPGADAAPRSWCGRNHLRGSTPRNHALGAGRRARRPADQPHAAERPEHLLRHGLPRGDLARLHLGHGSRDESRQRHGQRGPRVRRRRVAGPRHEHPAQSTLRPELRVLLGRPARRRQDGRGHGERRRVARCGDLDQAFRRQQRGDGPHRPRHQRQRASAA